MTLPLALTLGDPAGIGGEIALKAWSALRERVPFFLLGDAAHMSRVARDLAQRMDGPRALELRIVPILAPEEAAAASAEGLPVLDHPLPRPPEPGRPDPANAAAVVEIIARAVALVREGKALALCTNPIHKKALKDGAGFAFPGHTEFLAHLSGAALPVMMLAAPALKVVPVTIHIPLAEVPRALTPELLEATLRTAHRALFADFGIIAPRIAVAGLNPHAGEGGTMGREEADVIAPVLARLRADGLDVSGPHPADTLFHPAARDRYDAAVCMYHDQALIPLKTIDFEGGVNVTLGLDFVRTSPDHGTAYDIAGRNLANPSSLIAALELAHAIGNRRAG
jgi:4-hydroxythreonine-4-phosphate dehydrogenase